MSVVVVTDVTMTTDPKSQKCFPSRTIVQDTYTGIQFFDCLVLKTLIKSQGQTQISFRLTSITIFIIHHA